MNIWDVTEVGEMHRSVLLALFQSDEKVDTLVADLRAQGSVPLMMAAGFGEGQAAISMVLAATSTIVSALPLDSSLRLATMVRPEIVTQLACALAFFATTPEEITR